MIDSLQSLVYWHDPVEESFVYVIKKKAFAYYMDHVKRKGVFEHAQNAQIQIRTAHAQSLIRTIPLNWYIL